MGRLEYKYLVSIKWKDEVREIIMPHMTHDYYSEKMPNKEYTVRSVYLDTTALNSFYEKLSGVKIRNKFRIRGYNNLITSSNVFVEIKRKENDFVTKDRAQVLYKDLNDFLRNSDLSKVANHSVEYQQRLNSARNFFYYYKRDKLNPIINIIYEREALECKYGSGLRITFDMNIRSYLTQTFDTLFEEKSPELLYPSEFVLEIKYSRTLPSWVPKLINKLNLTRIAVSKYAFCLEKHMGNKNLIHSI